jgi:hypothetical protein
MSNAVSESAPFLETTPGVVIVSVCIFVTIVALLMRLRSKKNLEVKPVELAAGILPVIVFLLVSGKVKSLEVGDVKVELAFEKAAQSPITTQLQEVKLPVEHIQAFAKGSGSLVNEYRTMKVEGLTFVVGNDGYVESVIADYLQGIPSLRYIILNQRDGSLYAIAEARRLWDVFSSETKPFTLDEFTRVLNAGETKTLEGFPGLILAKDAIADTADRLTALKKMESLNIDFVAAVDASGKFAGVVSRSRVTSSMLVDIAERLQR